MSTAELTLPTETTFTPTERIQQVLAIEAAEQKGHATEFVAVARALHDGRKVNDSRIRAAIRNAGKKPEDLVALVDRMGQRAEWSEKYQEAIAAQQKWRDLTAAYEAHCNETRDYLQQRHAVEKAMYQELGALNVTANNAEHYACKLREIFHDADMMLRERECIAKSMRLVALIHKLDEEMKPGIGSTNTAGRMSRVVAKLRRLTGFEGPNADRERTKANAEMQKLKAVQDGLLAKRAELQKQLDAVRADEAAISQAKLTTI